MLGLMSVAVFLKLFGQAARAWWDDDATRLGASLACYTLFAIAPILLVATAIAGAAFGEEAVPSLLEGAGQQRAGAVATAIGSATFLVAAIGAFLELQVALNTRVVSRERSARDRGNLKP